MIYTMSNREADDAKAVNLVWSCNMHDHTLYAKGCSTNHELIVCKHRVIKFSH